MRIERFLKKNFDNYVFFRGKVDNFLMVEVMRAMKLPKIDFAFFDLCENFNGHIANWLFKNREAFAADCRFGLTVAAPTRLKTWEKTVLPISVNMDYDEQLEDLLVESKNNLAKDILGMPINVISARQKIRKNRAAEQTNVIRSIKAACSGFMMAMNNIDMTISRVYRYKEANDGKKHCEMVFVDFRFCEYVDGDDIIIDVIKKFDKQVCYGAQVLRYGRVYTSRKKTKKPIVLKNANAIARHMNIYGNFETIYDMQPCSRAHIKINAKKFGLDPEKTVAKIERRLQKYGLEA